MCKLVQDGINPNLVLDISGLTPLHHAVVFKNTEAILLLLSMGANPLLDDNEGITPLDRALETNNIEIIKVFAYHLSCEY